MCLFCELNVGVYIFECLDYSFLKIVSELGSKILGSGLLSGVFNTYKTCVLAFLSYSAELPNFDFFFEYP
jgi:hypothetical protein